MDPITIRVISIIKMAYINAPAFRKCFFNLLYLKGKDKTQNHKNTKAGMCFCLFTFLGQIPII
jgi:hypothetical protein